MVRFATVLLAMVAAGCARPSQAKGKPNVVFVIIDTLRADAVIDPQGLVDTPVLDALAKEGAAFSLAFSHAPMTLPSHTALFSSRFPGETHVLVNGRPVPEDLPLLGNHLESLGYQTTAVVALSTLMRASGGAQTLDRSFEHYEKAPGYIATAEVVAQHLDSVLDGLAHDRPVFLFAHFADPHEPYDAHGTVQRSADVFLNGQKLDHVLTPDGPSFDRDVELAPGDNLLELRGDAPFKLRTLRCVDGKQEIEPRFLEGEVRTATLELKASLANPDDGPRHVRLSFWLTDDAQLSELPGRYAREVEYSDRYVGELIRQLKERGLYDDTLLVFTSDHGEALGERGGGLGHVHTLYDELIHVPLIIKPPRGSQALEALRARTKELVSHVDVVPTVLDILGLPPLPGQRGHSLLTGVPTTPAFSETHRPEAVNDLLALRDTHWKLIFVANENRFLLFDLEKDPQEKHDVFAAEGKRFAEWQEELRSAAERSKDSALDLDGIDPAALEQMRAIGYFGR